MERFAQDFLDWLAPGAVYKVILMREIPYEVLLAQAPRGVWALIPFSKGGAQREVIEEIIQRLIPIADSDTKE